MPASASMGSPQNKQKTFMTGSFNHSSILRVVLAASSAALLAGCAAFSADIPEEIPADAMKRPVDLSVVCVLVNESVDSEQLVKSFEAGIRRFGSEPRLLEPGDGPPACSFVMTYDVATNSRVIDAVRFQTFENSVPAIEATGRANQGTSLTFDNVAAYTFQLLNQTKKRLGDRAVLPAAPAEDAAPAGAAAPAKAPEAKAAAQ